MDLARQENNKVNSNWQMPRESRKFTPFKNIYLEDKSDPLVDMAEVDMMKPMSKVKDKQPIEGDTEKLDDKLPKGVGLWDKEMLDNMLKEAGL